MSKSSGVFNLLQCLSDKRFSNKDDWLIIGYQLRDALDCQDAIDYWALKCPFTRKDYENILTDEEDNPKYKKYMTTILYEWARIDNKEKYKSFLEENLREDIYSVCSDNGFSRMFFNLCPNKYIHIEGKGWFCLNPNNVWEFQSKIPASISTDITENFRRVINECEKSVSDAKSKLTEKGHLSKSDAMRQLDARSEELVKLIKKLGSASTVRNMKEFIPSYYKDDKVFDKMDANRYIFSCENKVFDLKAKIWRKIQPEDYISITTGYEYEEETEASLKIQEEVNKFIKSCFRTEE
jgi:hypothetical protein